jgi:hypothetical protein
MRPLREAMRDRDNSTYHAAIRASRHAAEAELGGGADFVGDRVDAGPVRQNRVPYAEG